MNREEKVRNLLTELIDMIDNGSQKDLDRADEIGEIIIEALENQKTGHWKKISPAGIMECSVCGGNVLTSDIEAYKYCHHCGAKMFEPQESEKLKGE